MSSEVARKTAALDCSLRGRPGRARGRPSTRSSVIDNQRASILNASFSIRYRGLFRSASEVADTVDELRATTAEIFAGWLDGGTAYFRARGLPAATARDVTVVLIGALEGAFVLARTLRSTEPLLATGRVLAPQYRRDRADRTIVGHNGRVTAVTDPNGIQWNVHRRWWPFPDLFDFVDFDFISWIFALPFLFLWPFWFAMKGLGVKWRIVIERNHSEVGSELVRGYRRSGRRIDELAQQLAQGRSSGYSGYSGQFVL